MPATTRENHFTQARIQSEHIAILGDKYNPVFLPISDEPIPSSYGTMVAKVDKESFCDVDSVVCVMAATDNPDEFIRKMVPAIPKGVTKRYSVKMSIVSQADDLPEDGDFKKGPSQVIRK